MRYVKFEDWDWTGKIREFFSSFVKESPTTLGKIREFDFRLMKVFLVLLSMTIF